MDLHKLDIHSLKDAFAKGDATPADAIRSIAAARDSRDPEIGGYLSFDVETALNEAAHADLSKPLGGVPVAIKDVINVRDQPCSCGSRILEGKYTSPYDATVIARLRQAGAIPLGRTNMDEFAMGSSTENSGIQLTRNPWDTARIPGGSSGGSAAVIAADEAIAALGTDTGGSIRQPAALCGCVGLKPTYGRVSRFGLVAYASSLDQIGPMTKTTRDAALLLNVISGKDPSDSTSTTHEVPDFTAGLAAGVAGMKIGLPKEYFIDGIDAPVRSAVDDAIKQLESLGAEIREVSLPHTEFAIAAYYIIATAEASANLARFDGVRYGHRTSEKVDLLGNYTKTREEGFGDEVKRRIILGTYVLSSGYHDQFYIKAQKVRTLIRQDFTNAFNEVDVIASPTTPSLAFRFGEKTADPLQMYLEDIFTIAANLSGICGISVPCGFARETEGDKRLPVGLQLMGKPFDEQAILNAAHAFEQSTEWHKARPEAN